jgi:hypothetical protein
MAEKKQKKVVAKRTGVTARKISLEMSITKEERAAITKLSKTMNKELGSGLHFTLTHEQVIEQIIKSRLAQA